MLFTSGYHLFPEWLLLRKKLHGFSLKHGSLCYSGISLPGRGISGAQNDELQLTERDPLYLFIAGELI